MKKILILLFIVVSFVTGILFFNKKEEVVVFNSIWTEADQKQMSEILVALMFFKEGLKSSDSEYNEDKSLTLWDFFKSDQSFKEWIKMWKEEKKNDNYKLKIKQDLKDYNKELVAAVLETARSGNPSFMGKNGWTLLHLACAFDKEELGLRLIELGAPLNVIAGSNKGSSLDRFLEINNTPLGLVVYKSMVETLYDSKSSSSIERLKARLALIEALVKKGADLNFRTSDSRGMEFPLLYLSCVPSGGEDVVDPQIPLKLIELGACVETPVCFRGEVWSPLSIPVLFQLPEVVQKICEKGVKPSDTVQPILGMTISNLLSPSFDMRKRAFRMLDILLKYGMDINSVLQKKDKVFIFLDETALTFLCSCKSEKRILTEDESDLWKKAILLVLEKGADANRPNGRGELPLMLVLRNMDKNPDITIEIARTLLDHGADANLTDQHGKSVIDQLDSLEKIQKEKIMKHLPELKRK